MAMEALPSPMSARRTAAIGAFIVALGPISLSLYSPALPTLTTVFGTSMSALSLTVTLYFLGFAFAQLVCGPLSDAYGRRPVAIAFFAIYLLGSLMAVMAPTIGILMASRVLQGIGVAAGAAISRAFVRDQFIGAAAARIMNLIGLMLAVGPAVSPTIGGLILTYVGWHAIFVAMAAYGVAVILVLSILARETNRHPDVMAARPGRVLRNYLALLGEPSFMRPGLLLGLTVGGLYTFAPLLPFVLIGRVGLTPAQFGLAMVAQTGSYALGAFVTGRLLRRMDHDRVLKLGLGVVTLAGLGFALGFRLLPLSTVTVMTPVAVWAFGIAMVSPGATTAALAGFPLMAGAASALAGFMQMGGGLLGSALASALFADPVQAIAVVMPVMMFLAVAAQITLHRRQNRSSPDPAQAVSDPGALAGAAGDEGLQR